MTTPNLIFNLIFYTILLYRRLELLVQTYSISSMLLFWCPYMVINVSVKCNGGLLPDVILLTQCDSIGEPFKYHIVFLSLQPMFEPKPFD